MARAIGSIRHVAIATVYQRGFLPFRYSDVELKPAVAGIRILPVAVSSLPFRRRSLYWERSFHAGAADSGGRFQRVRKARRRKR